MGGEGGGGVQTIASLSQLTLCLDQKCSLTIFSLLSGKMAKYLPKTEYSVTLSKSMLFIKLKQLSMALATEELAVEVSHSKQQLLWQLPQENSIAAAKNCRDQFKIYFQILFYSF